jgi:hypothetical protein
MPHSLRPSPSPGLARVSSSESTSVSNASQAAVEASRAATLAWQAKKPNCGIESRKIRNPSPTSSRSGSMDTSNVKSPSMPDTTSLLDAPLIDFSTPVMSASSTQEPLQPWAPLSPAPTPPPQSQPETYQPSGRKLPQLTSRNLGRSKATGHRPVRPPNKPLSPTHPRSSFAPDLSEPLEQLHELPISVSISEDISVEQELSREEKALRELKGVDEDLAKTILNDIVVRGDEVQWDDIGTTHSN